MKNKKSGGALVFVLLVIIVILLVLLYLALTGKFSIDDNSVSEETTLQDTNEGQIEEETTNTKADILELYEEKLSGQDRYALTDINSDGILDLITHKEDTSSDKVIANYTFYTYSNGKVVELGKVSGRVEDNILYKMEDNTLLVVYGHLGREVATTYKIENEALVEISSTSRDISSGESYTKGDSVIPFDFTTDTIQFEVYREQ